MFVGTSVPGICAPPHPSVPLNHRVYTMSHTRPPVAKDVPPAGSIARLLLADASELVLPGAASA